MLARALSVLSLAALTAVTLVPSAAGATDRAVLVRPTTTTEGEQSAADDTLTWGIAPATPGEADDRVSFRLELEPGQSHTDHVEVTNFSDRPITFGLDASDGVVTDDGLFDLLPRSEEPTGSGAWIEIQDEVTVEAGAGVVVPFTLTVPEDALPGDHPGGIAAGITTAVPDAQGSDVSFDARVGVRIHLRVAGDVVPQVTITELDATYETSWNPLEPGVLTLTWTVLNGGNVRLGAEQTLDVVGPFGLDPGVVAQVVASQREILPGQSETVTVPVEAWPLGPLTASIGSTQNVVGEDVVDADLPVAEAGTTVWAVPWPWVVVLIAGLVFVTGLLWRRRRRKRTMARALAEARAAGAREAAAATEPAPTEPTSDDVETDART